MSQLDLGAKPKMLQLTDELIAKPSSFRKSIILAAELGTSDDAGAARAMGVAQEMWSRFKTDGRTGVNPDRLEGFMDNVGNELPLFHLALRRGYRLVEIETETQRQLRVEREARIEAERKLRDYEDMMRRIMVGRPA